MNLAIAADLSPYYQYQFNRQKEPIGAEILMRPSLGVITDVINILNNKRQIHYLDKIAFDWALKFKQKHLNLDCSCNVAGQSLLERIYVSWIEKSDPTNTIKLELTEDRLFKTFALKQIFKLHRIGFDFSLDDYGSGFNGLNRLSTLPLSEVKIDRYLIEQLPSKKAVIILKSTIDLVKELGLDLVAEGVETKEQWQILVDLGCDRFQGYYLHKPEAFKHN